MLTQEVLQLARTIWDYHHMNHELVKSDCIMVLGSHDERVAVRGAEVYLQGYAPVIVFSGGLGRLTEGMWTETEADKFSKIAIDMGVPPEAVLVENRSTNTGENIVLSMELLKSKGIKPESFIVVQKPYMERRSYATFRQHLPDQDVRITSPQISFDEYPTADIPLEHVIQIMVGDLQRIKVYPAKGFQIHQDIPEDVWSAYQRLIALGFDQQVIAEE